MLVFLKLLILVLLLPACKQTEQTSIPQNITPTKTSNFSCIGKVKDVELQYDANYIVLESAIPRNEDGSRNDLYFNNVLYYGSMFIPFSFDFINGSVGAKFMSMYPETVTWKDVQISDTAYPYDVPGITILDEDLRFFPKPMIDYYKNIQNTGAKKGDKAVAIKARVSLHAFFCMEASAPPLSSDQFKFYVPVDPQTIFEVVPKNDWRKILNPISGEAVVNQPCVDPLGVGARENRPHMNNNIFYYFWHPTLKGIDAKNKPFDCSQWYKPGVSYQDLKVSLFEKNTQSDQELPFKEIVSSKKPVDIKVVIGFTKNPHAPIDEKWFKSIFDKIFESSKKEFDQLIPKSNKEFVQDESVDKMMILLWRLKDQLLIDSKELEVDENLINVKINGKLKTSKLAVKLNFYLGTTKTDIESFDRTRNEVANGLFRSDIFIYDGHANFGEALSPNTLNLDSFVQTFKGEKPQNQIIALFSCQAFFNYEPKKFFSLPKVTKRGWIHSLGNYKSISSNGTLGVLASLDQAALTGEAIPFEKWAKVFSNDNFLMRTVIENDAKP